MAGKSGKLTLKQNSGTTTDDAKGYIEWFTTKISDNNYKLNFSFYAATAVSAMSSTFWSLTIGPYTNSGSKRIDSSEYSLIVSDSINITVDDSGVWNNTISASFEYNSMILVGSQLHGCSGNWTKLTVADPDYKVYYYKNDGSGERFYFNNGYNIGDTHTIISNIPVHSGNTTRSDTFTITGDANGGNSNIICIAKKNINIIHTFLGWSENSSAISASYAPGGQFSIKKSISLYAVWKTSEVVSGYENNTIANLDAAIKDYEGDFYDITLVPNNGEDNIIYKAGQGLGYTFLGWSSSKTNISILANTTSYTTDTTVYAVWEENIVDNRIINLPKPSKSTGKTIEVTVTLDTNGGITSNDSFKTNARTFYKLEGWGTANGDSSTIVSDPYIPDGNSITLYAIWGKDDIIDAQPISLPISNKKDYRFLGWATNPSSTEYVDMEYTPTQVTTTLYAIYRSLYTGEMYIWLNDRWRKISPHLNYQGIFNKCINNT